MKIVVVTEIVMSVLSNVDMIAFIPKKRALVHNTVLLTRSTFWLLTYQYQDYS